MLTPKQLGLVAVVFGHGRLGLRRLEAARLLWDADSATNRRQGIRQLLLEIRTRLGCSIIETPQDVLRPAHDVLCDLTTFNSAVEQGALLQAALLMREGFIATGVVHSKAHDDWRRGRCNRLRADLRTSASLRRTRSFSRGDWAAAHDAAEALYALNPEDLQVVERVIDARGRVGQIASAEDAFGRYVGSLSHGATPATGVVQAIDRVRETTHATREAGLAEASRLPFVGRHRVLRAASDTLDAVREAGFHFLIVSGESGIGKTRVLNEVHRDALLQGFRCLRAQPVELEQSIPLNPFVDALSELDLGLHLESLGSPWRSSIASVLPPGTLDADVEEPPPIRASALSRRLLDSFLLLFEQLAQERPTLLLLDDLHWADATTVSALQFLQRRWRQGGLGVVATIRPDQVRITDPVATYLTGRGELSVQQIELSALSTAEALELIHEISEGSVPTAHAHRLCAIAGQHPLYLSELTKEFLAGRLAFPELPSDQLAIPSSLGQMLDARLSAIDESAMMVAGVLAVAARPLQLVRIGELTSMPMDRTMCAVETLVRTRFVETVGDSLRIAHELFRSAIYRRLGEPRQALHHRAIALQLLADDAAEDSPGELAIHCARGGQDDLAAKHGWVAARRAMEAGAVAEAVKFFEVVAERDRDPTRRASATAELARALDLARDITRANPQLSLAAERLRSIGRPEEARRLEIKRIEGLAELAEASVEDLIDGLGAIKQEARRWEDSESLVLAIDVELHLLHRSGEIGRIPILLREMKALSDTTCTRTRILCLAGLALGVFFGSPEEALGAAHAAVELAEEADGYRLRALIRLMVVLQARGLLLIPESNRYVSEARVLAERSGDVLARFSIESNLAAAHLDVGDVEGAEALMAQVGGLAGCGEMDINRLVQANNEAELFLAQNEFRRAADAFEAAAAFLGPTTPTYMRDLVNAGIGLCALESGDLAEARRREAFLHAPPTYWYFDPTTLVAFRSRLMVRRGNAQQAIKLLGDVAGGLKGRLTTAWLKVVLLQLRVMVRSSPKAAHGLAGAMAREARILRLEHMHREFLALQKRPG